MKTKAITLLIFILFISACSGGGGSSSGSDSDTSTQPITADPSDPNNTGGDDPTDVDFSDPDDPSEPTYAFGGEYEGSCVVTALGINSRSCEGVMNIYHEEGGDTLGFMGMLNVDMGITKASYPVSTSPLNIVDGNLVDPDSGNDFGTIGPDGFIVNQTNGDFMRFDRTPSGGFEYEGEYQDATYGRVLIEGTLEKVAE